MNLLALYLPIDVTESFLFSDINSPTQTVAEKMTRIQITIANICGECTGC